jgi:hypothetical protein
MDLSKGFTGIFYQRVPPEFYQGILSKRFFQGILSKGFIRNVIERFNRGVLLEFYQGVSSRVIRVLVEYYPTPVK